jgi:hypothetical protein
MKKSFEETTRGYPDPDLPEGRGITVALLILAVIAVMAFIYWLYWLFNL